MLMSPEVEYSMCCCAILCCYLERFLGDIHFNSVMKRTNNNEKEMEELDTPRILRDLLASSHVIDALGEDVIFLLKLLVGPPVGIV
jgi:hypothetical protein